MYVTVLLDLTGGFMGTFTIGHILQTKDADLKVRISSSLPKLVGCIYQACGAWENKPGFNTGAHYDIQVCPDLSIEIKVRKVPIKLEFVPPPLQPMTAPKKTRKPVLRPKAA